MHLSTQTLNTGAPQVTVTCRLFGIRVSHTVVLLGLTSMFTDVSSEMVNAILPVYLVLQLGFTPLHFGLFDGMYQGVTAVVRVPAGLMADRRQRYKEVAGAGYALPAACKLGLWAAGPLWVATLGLLVLDRSGKGIRTAPRDALISLSSPPARLTEAFGVHRALDTVGALLGPLAAFALLGLVPAGYDVVFVVSFCLGVVGLGILLSFVANVKDDSGDPGQRSSLRAAVDLFREPGIRGVLFAGAILSVATVSDSLVYLTLQQQTSMDAQYFPLPFMGTSLTYLLLAAPTGRIADRAGRWKLLLAGHIPLGVAYALFLLRSEPGVAKSTGGVVPLGMYYASTDGVIMAIASRHLPARLMTGGLATLTTVNALGRLLASALYGALWTWRRFRRAQRGCGGRWRRLRDACCPPERSSRSPHRRLSLRPYRLLRVQARPQMGTAVPLLWTGL